MIIRRYRLALVAALLSGWSVGFAGVVDPVLLNMSFTGPGDQPPGSLTGAFGFTVFPGDSIFDAFGVETGPIEPSSTIFSDGQAPDNGNTTFGDAGETVSTILFSAGGPLVLDGYQVTLAADGPAPSPRGTELFRFRVAGEFDDDQFDNNSASGTVTRMFPFTQVSRYFQVDLTATTSSGQRVGEIDAVVPNPIPGVFFVDPILFNATTNGPGDELAGLGTNFAASSKALGTDAIEDAFGNADGPVEPNTFIFADGGVADNFNNTFDVGSETIDSLSWSTLSNVHLGGMQITLFSDDPLGGLGTRKRGTELLRVFVENTLVKTIDFNSEGLTLPFLFDGGPIVGNDFRIELTRGVGGFGPRIVEIDAIVVPEASSVILGGLVLLVAGLAVRNSRRSAE